MPKLSQGLSEVSTVIVPLPEAAYQLEIAEVEVGQSKSKLDMVTVTYKVTEGDFKGRQLRDYFVLETKEHQPNESGLRTLKRLIVASLGEDRANSEDFDTDELQGAIVTGFVKQEDYDDEAGDTQISNKIKKILPA